MDASVLSRLGARVRSSSLTAALWMALVGAAAPAGAAVQISQIYGGGGYSGALFNTD